MSDIIVVRGAGDIATGIAHRLHRCGFRVLMTEIERPLVVRRFAAFASAVPVGRAEVEGVCAVRVDNTGEVFEIWKDNNIPVLCDSQCRVLGELKPLAVIDAIMAKRNTGTFINMAPITIGVGPGFEAGSDVDAVIETRRGHNLGKVILKGSAEADTGMPGNIMGYSRERLLRAPASGVIRNILEIGDMVKQGDIIAQVEEEPVKSLIDGVIRGLIADGTEVKKGLKVGDVDPRGVREYCFTISDKSRSVAGGALEALLYLKKERFGG